MPTDAKVNALRHADRVLQTAATLLRLSCDMRFMRQRQHGELCAFEARRETELVELREQLLGGTYCHAPLMGNSWGSALRLVRV